jgi:hypothetical protein
MKYWLRSGLGPVVVSAATVVGFAACSGEDPAPSSVVDDAPDASSGALKINKFDLDVSSRAQTRISDLTSRFVVGAKPKLPGGAAPPMLAPSSVPPALRQQLAATATPTMEARPAILPSEVERFVSEGEHVRAVLPPVRPGMDERRTTVLLPARSNGPVRLEDDDTGLAIEFALTGASPDSKLEVADGFGIYIGGGAERTDVLHRVTAAGTEDFISLDKPPAKNEVSYEVDVSGVAGLRLVGGVLEFLNEEGDPRLRVKRPYLVDANDEMHAATLGLSGCAYDTDQRVPWGRPVTAPGSDHCTVTVSWDGTNVQYPALLDPAWTATGSLAAPRQLHGATRLNSGEVVVFGGNGNLGWAQDAERRNPVSGSFTGAGTMIYGRQWPGFANLGDYVLAVVGNSTNYQFELYSVFDNSWAAGTTNMRWADVCCYYNYWPDRVQTVNVGKKAFVFQLIYNGLFPYPTDFESWDLDNDGVPIGDVHDIEWVSLANPPAGHKFGTVIALKTGIYADHLMFVGGQDTGMSTQLATVSLYNPEKDLWLDPGTIPDMNNARGDSPKVLELSDGRVLVVGGGGSSPTSTEVYDFGTETWTNSGNYGSQQQTQSNGNMLAVYQNPASVQAGKVIMVGGECCFTNSAQYAYVFDPNALNWFSFQTGYHTRGGNGQLVGLNDGRLLAVPADPDLPNGYSDKVAIWDFRQDGDQCSDTRQCKSANCKNPGSNGICCDKPCDGLCETCSASNQIGGADGKCGFKSSGTNDNDCAVVSGEPCGFTGTCNGSGACTIHPNLEVCKVETTCLNPTVEYVDDKCDGSSHLCIDGKTAPCTTGYTCREDQGGCVTSCIQDDWCTTDTHYCDTDLEKCKIKKNVGAPCFTDSSCATGSCVDGFCCDDACDGLCESCKASDQADGTDGFCGPREAGRSETACAPDGSACGQTGTCNGVGGCTLHPLNEVCKVETTCSAATVEFADDKCNGSASTCQDGGTTNCAAGYTCRNDQGGCVTSCVDHTWCTTATHFCDQSDSKCKVKKGNGQACFGDPGVCATGNCVDGFCCDSVCDGLCESCKASDQADGTDGFCGPREPGAVEAACNAVSGEPCGSLGTCDGSGECTLHPDGEVCKVETTCSSTTAEFADDICDGISVLCQEGGTTNCAAGYTCQAGTGCLTSCDANSDCVTATHWCDTVNDQKCKVKRDDGLACDFGTQCKNGNCVDGVCCNTACGGTCQACSNLLTGKPNGECHAIPVNNDPQSECEPASAASSCGITGNCNGSEGAPACQFWSNTTQCASQICASATSQQLASSCSGSGGGCPAGAVQNCTAGYLCKSNACLTTCNDDTDCTSGYYCTGVGGQCLADVAKGVSCTKDTMCASGLVCAGDGVVGEDNVCCDQECDGVCRSCLNSRNGGLGNGTCGLAPDNSDPDEDCPNGQNFCDATGTCNASGQCRLYQAVGTYCGDNICDEGNVFKPECNGAGTCVNTVQPSCTPYTCLDTEQCRTACSDPAHCVEGTFCENGQCLGALPPGSACSKDSECGSKHCADIGVGELEGDDGAGGAGGAGGGGDIAGVCCDEACNTACRACKASLKGSGQDGACEDVKPNTDPRDDCAADPSDQCGYDGLCGDGSCRLSPSGTSCGDSSCSGNNVLGQICNGGGDCINATGATPCDPYLCREEGGTGSCTSPCGEDSDCQTGFYCVDGTCLAKAALGKTCSESVECESGFCVDGLCCDASCRGQCEACNLPGDEGICTPVQGEPVGDRAACEQSGEECGGECDGVTADSCSYPDDSFTCGEPSCADGFASSSSCDGNGFCVADDDEECQPYSCGGDECKRRCEIDDDCSQGFACDATTGNCTPAAVASVCSDDRTESVGRGGTTICRPYLCDISRGACAVSCAATTDCSEGFVCEPTTKACITIPPKSSIEDEACSCRTVGGRDNRSGYGLLAALSFLFAGLRRSNRRSRGKHKAVTVAELE